jgi:hypothetical protein
MGQCQGNPGPQPATIWNDVQTDEIFYLTRAPFSVYITPQCARSKVARGVRLRSIPFHIANVFGASAISYSLGLEEEHR